MSNTFDTLNWFISLGNKFSWKNIVDCALVFVTSTEFKQQATKQNTIPVVVWYTKYKIKKKPKTENRKRRHWHGILSVQQNKILKASWKKVARMNGKVYTAYLTILWHKRKKWSGGGCTHIPWLKISSNK